MEEELRPRSFLGPPSDLKEVPVLYLDCPVRSFPLPLNPRYKPDSSADSAPAKTAPRKEPRSKRRETKRRKKATSKAYRHQREEAIVPVNSWLESIDVPPSIAISHQKTVA